MREPSLDPPAEDLCGEGAEHDLGALLWRLRHLDDADGTVCALASVIADRLEEDRVVRMDDLLDAAETWRRDADRRARGMREEDD